ncbi:NAD(P)/FAD-dependent oxidoreductase [Candidatus Bathyarchaeota archaeon]|nr:MAG: NAD(P)/FAD-dependent oxidoreductase [Candidatus Bathyarchaeota archaeon]TMI58738.1 MAG: NAD(P)/FAD-dependent oxidoreductase [Candidatus Bathyarchaeota archaeon]
MTFPLGSTSDRYDVVTVGAGVAGCEAALGAAKMNARVLLLEEHPQVGLPSHCSGVVSLSGLELLGLDAHSSFSQKLIHGARFFPPRGESIEIRKKDPVALILNRMKLDQFLAKQAVAAGVELRAKTRASKFERTADGDSLSLADGSKVASKVVIDASGVGSRLSEQAGLRAPDWGEILPGLQYELVDMKEQSDLVELFFGSKRAPGFFAWSIPTGKNSARVGLASKKGNVKKFLDDLVKEQWPKANIDATKSGSVLVAGPISRCWSPGFIVVGDAAGQVKQTTGGGIVIGGYCGKLSGIAAASAATNVGIQAEQFLRNYDAQWREKFGSDLRKMGLARKLFAGLSDETLDRLFSVLRDNVSEIEAEGDMDFQGKIITRMLKKRKIATLLPRVAADAVKAIFS